LNEHVIIICAPSFYFLKYSQLLSSGEPKPDVKWYHGDERIKPKKGDKRIRTGYDSNNDLYVLQIESAIIEDSGQYTIKLVNELGSAKATVSVNISQDAKHEISKEAATLDDKSAIEMKTETSSKKEDNDLEIKVQWESEAAEESRAASEKQDSSKTLLGDEDEGVPVKVIDIGAPVNVITSSEDIPKKETKEKEIEEKQSLENSNKLEEKIVVHEEQKLIVTEEKSHQVKNIITIEPKPVSAVKSNLEETAEDSDSRGITKNEFAESTVESVSEETAAKSQSEEIGTQEIRKFPAFILKPDPASVQIGDDIQLKCQISGITARAGFVGCRPA